MLSKPHSLALLVAAYTSACCDPPAVVEGDYPLACPAGWEGVNSLTGCTPTAAALDELGADGTGGFVGIVSDIDGTCEPTANPRPPGRCVERRRPRALRVRPMMERSGQWRTTCDGEENFCADVSTESAPAIEVPTTEDGQFLVNLAPGPHALHLVFSDCERPECVGCAVDPGEYRVVAVVIDRAQWF